METKLSGLPIISTHAARCRDCYRCVRVCPVKAIRVRQGQASVDEARCIHCGTCVRECPQGAKTYRRDVERVVELLDSPHRVAASVAPSYAGLFQPWEQARLASALRRAGFAVVAPTSVGAGPVANEIARRVAAEPAGSHFATSCPAVVRYLERYRPADLDRLVHVVSPMVAHGRMLRSEHPGMDVVFIGPCVAKKGEALRHPDDVAAVLTFPEMRELLAVRGVTLESCEESAFDQTPDPRALRFPLAGGSLSAAGLETGLLSGVATCACGQLEIDGALDLLAGSEAMVVEALFCPWGCVNGPAAGVSEGSTRDVARRRLALLKATVHPSAGAICPEPGPSVDLSETVGAQTPARVATEQAIRDVLATTGKLAPVDQLNCGACGYPSCRDQAVGVVLELAEPEMCMPYMRRLAEHRSDRIMDTSPNGIVILDERLQIVAMNPAFLRLFACTESHRGKPISSIMDPEPFERLATGVQERIEGQEKLDRYDLVIHRILYALREERQYIGIFVNMTPNQKSRDRLTALRSAAVLQARELQEHQVKLAERMVDLLGEYNAQGERLLESLVELGGEEDTEPQPDPRPRRPGPR